MNKNETISMEAYKALLSKHNLLVDRVRRMRVFQKQYFMYRASDDLRASKKLENEVDGIISREIKEQKSKQQSMF